MLCCRFVSVAEADDVLAPLRLHLRRAGDMIPKPETRNPLSLVFAVLTLRLPKLPSDPL